MKRIGILFGQERTFPQALAQRINQRAQATGKKTIAEPVKVGGMGLETAAGYDLVLDRISQDVPFYRAVLKQMAFGGTVVVNNPFWWSADDKYFNNVLAHRMGVAVPRTVLLPSKQHPPDTTSASMSNLQYPLDWEKIFEYVGFPAYFKPHAGGGWKSVFRVTNPEEFFAAYDQTGTLVMMLQEEVVFEDYYRCYVLGGKHVRVMRWDPRKSFHERYVRAGEAVPAALAGRIEADCLKLAAALGYEFDTMEFAVRDGVPYAIDFLNPAPDADRVSVGEANFEWVVATTADWLLERVEQDPAEPIKPAWRALLAGAPAAAPARR